MINTRRWKIKFVVRDTKIEEECRKYLYKAFHFSKTPRLKKTLKEKWFEWNPEFCSLYHHSLRLSSEYGLINITFDHDISNISADFFIWHYFLSSSSWLLRIFHKQSTPKIILVISNLFPVANVVFVAVITDNTRNLGWRKVTSSRLLLGSNSFIMLNIETTTLL